MAIVIASPMSFAGAWQRVRAWGSRIQNRAAGIAYWILAAPLLLVPWWTVVIAWYVVVFPLVWIVAIPWRLFRRGSRRDKEIIRRLGGTEP